MNSTELSLSELNTLLNGFGYSFTIQNKKFIEFKNIKENIYFGSVFDFYKGDAPIEKTTLGTILAHIQCDMLWLKTLPTNEYNIQLIEFNKLHDCIFALYRKNKIKNILGYLENE